MDGKQENTSQSGTESVALKETREAIRDTFECSRGSVAHIDLSHQSESDSEDSSDSQGRRQA